MEEEQRNSSNNYKEKKMYKFYSFQPGSSLNVVEKFEKRLRKKDLKKVMSIDKCHFYLVFCPIVSRVQTDITSAMEAIPDGKPVILVVLHHTFSADYSVPKSSGLAATSKRVILTVNCLFHETKGLLDCSQNDDAVREIMRDVHIKGKKKLWKKVKPKSERRRELNPSDGPAHELQATGELTVQNFPAESNSGTKEKKMYKFYSFQPGSSLNVVEKFEKRLRKKDLKKVMSIDKCHFYLVFCPIVSRVQTDITSAMEAVPDGRPVILVVLHHTFSADYSVPKSGLAPTTKPGQHVILTVNCLFHETKGLLDCSQNDDAVREIMRDVHIKGKKKLWKKVKPKK